MLRLLFLLGVALFSLIEIGCGGASVAGAGRPRLTSAMTSRDLVLFDDGVDFVSDPGALSGVWFQAWEADLDNRITRADVVAVVGIASVSHSEQEADGDAKFVLAPEAERVLKGEWPDEEALVSGSGSPGFVTVERGRVRVLEGTYVMFVKWASGPQRDIVPRWHLSRAEGAVLESVSRRLGQSDSRTVVVNYTDTP